MYKKTNEKNWVSWQTRKLSFGFELTFFPGLREGSCMGDALCHIWSWCGRYSGGSVSGFNLHLVGSVQWLGLRHPVPTAVLCGVSPRHQYLWLFYGVHSGAGTSHWGRGEEYRSTTVYWVPILQQRRWTAVSVSYLSHDCIFCNYRCCVVSPKVLVWERNYTFKTRFPALLQEIWAGETRKREKGGLPYGEKGKIRELWTVIQVN